MPKKIFIFLILFIVLAGVLMPNVTHANILTKIAGEVIQSSSNLFWTPLFVVTGSVLMFVSSFLLIISGWLFDIVIEFTILNMSDNIGAGSNIGNSISTAWATLRDVANMAFIFVLLYAAFKTMFDSNFSAFNTTVKNIIIAALLINFSLFFSKVVIDASNIVSIGFYNSIITNDAQIGSTILGGTANFNGISGGYMRMLKMQTWYHANILENGFNFQQVFLTGFMSSTFMFISAIIFFIASIMFVARFVILIFLMILSPLAFIAFIIPGMEKRFKDWKSALINQAFFAPLFFALTWVAFKLGNALMDPANTTTWVDLIKNPSKDTSILLLNYVLTTGFFIAALVFSKQMAGKTGNIGMAVGGTVALGGAAAVGRNTVGRGAQWVSENKRADWEKSRLGRIGLWTAEKTAGSGFDARALADTSLGKAVGAGKIMGDLGKAGGKGGFSKAVEEKAKKKADYAKKVYGQTPQEADEVKKLKPEYNTEVEKEEARIKQERINAYNKAEEARKKHLEDKLDPERKTAVENLKLSKNKATEELEEIERTRGNKSSPQYFQKEKEIENITNRMKDESAKIEAAKRAIEETDEYRELKVKADVARQQANPKTKINDKDYSETFKEKEIVKKYQYASKAGEERMEAYAKRLERWGTAGNKAAAKKVRDVIAGKDKKDTRKRMEQWAKEEGLKIKFDEGETPEESKPPQE
ncbi:MAG: hypothetical protein UR80_C0010G0005 [Parcubacteria group bacterium GW2011_GWB1_35_5]|nr:MAG: hypothetical protein UR80_C0010G0005 [Parcubacteria group bacterium GW2011_GWB1_35_5]